MPIILILLILSIYLFANRKYLTDYKVYPLLIIIFINLIAELLAFFLNIHYQEIQKSGNTMWVYNFSIVIEIVCYSLIYKKIFKSKCYIYLINLSIFTIPTIFFIVSLADYSKIFTFNTIVFTYECFFILLLTLGFFIELFRADYFYVSPIKQFFFWLSTGLLLCYLGGVLFLINREYIFKISPQINIYLKNLNFLLNCFLYLCILIAVKCLKKYPNLQIQSF